jgi:hypothetical protein
MTRELPIIFSAPMIRAILDGRKRQDLRVAKQCDLERATNSVIRNGASYHFRFPWRPGDCLYVKETWAITTNVNEERNWPGRPHKPADGDDGRVSSAIYRADGAWSWCDDDGFQTERSYWRPSIHMPKWAARIWLTVTDVRVQRVQEISEADARAEGWPGNPEPPYGCHHPRLWFKLTWNDIYGPGAWERNDWVAATSFERDR